jgi:hypothetical protein
LSDLPHNGPESLFDADFSGFLFPMTVAEKFCDKQKAYKFVVFIKIIKPLL